MIGEATETAPAGAATPSLTIAGHDPVTIALTEPVVVIGRDRGCGVVLDDITVSRRHAELRREGGAVVLTDLGSLNGTYLNRTPVESAVVHDGDTIWIGDHRMTFRSPPVARLLRLPDWETTVPSPRPPASGTHRGTVLAEFAHDIVPKPAGTCA
ncbi:FHA domain-containing protein [Lentzea sp. BCCO 10_0798]|uniref:FHA domain-containing protein n=1 Tax=Lentzea kristufekii TaxID=3095430 RepID=A0ABU4TRG8_9PSEU|nr:FHA domain-containing protein [Lentzea sp. BCCO 10_0798]MDX8050807.1 FHA domain-containing protein [Lentzea sp. BCCO 10_0798]